MTRDEASLTRLPTHIQSFLCPSNHRKNVNESHPCCIFRTVVGDAHSEIEYQGTAVASDIGGYEIEGTFPPLAEEELNRNCSSTAVEDDNRSLTAGQLNTWANALAHEILERLGKDPEPVLMLMRDPGIGVVVATLGVLKAGKIYTPVEGAFGTAGRSAHILEDSGARLIVTDSDHLLVANQFSKGRADILNIDDLDGIPDPGKPGLPLSPEQPACLLYTSGSTGKPRGVVYSHRSVLHMVRGQIRYHQLHSSDRMLLTASAGVVGGKRMTLSGILSGAVIVPFNLREKGLREMESFIASQRITMIQTVPTVFRRFVAGIQDNCHLASVRLVRLGGEPLMRSDFDLFRQHFGPDAQFANGMGSTESGTISVLIASHDTRFDEGRLPAGRPAEGFTCILRDETGNPLPPGSEGDLCVQSRFLPDGYWKRPDLTNLVFHDVAGVDGLREYRTGDLARIDESGMITLLGRRDSQVKIHGFRVEPEEIEASLLAWAPVQSAAVIASPMGDGGTQLVGYLQPKPGARISTDEARLHLSRSLPPHMVPKRFVVLDTFPLTDTGKVDRRSLPAPDKADINDLSAVPPCDETERTLAWIWKKELGLQVRDRTDNFFELGGDSMHAATLCGALERSFGVAIKPVELLETPELHQLSGRIRGRLKRTQGATLLKASSTAPPLFLFPRAGGDGLIFRDLAKELGADCPIYAMSPPGLHTESGFDETIETIASGHVSTIEAIQPVGDLRLAGISFGGSTAWETARQLQAKGRKVVFLGLFDSFSPRYRSTNFPRSRPYEMGQRLRLHLAALHRLPFQEKWTYVRDRIMSRVVSGRRLDQEIRTREEEDLFEKIYKRDLQALLLYKPEHLDIDVTLFRCAIHFQKELGQSRDYGWSEFCDGNLAVLDVPGYHTTMLAPPFVRETASMLEQCLSGSQK